jgi:m7GpppX diphosphatase
MAHPATPTSFSALNQFVFERILNEDPLTHSLIVLGTFPSPDPDNQVKAIVRIEKTALNLGDGSKIFGDNGIIKKAQLEESTDIVRM